MRVLALTVALCACDVNVHVTADGQWPSGLIPGDTDGGDSAAPPAGDSECAASGDAACSLPVARVALIGDSTARPWGPALDGLRSDFEVFDFAIPGSSTAQVMDQWIYNAHPTAPRTVVILAGIVDLLNGLTAAQAFNTLSQIYHSTHDFAVRTYVVTVLPNTTVNATQLAQLNTSIRGAAVDGVIDVWDEFTAHPEYFLPDGTHLNAAGVQRLAELVASAVPPQ